MFLSSLLRVWCVVFYVVVGVGGGGIAEELNIFNLILLLKEEGGRRNCRGIEIEIFKFN